MVSSLEQPIKTNKHTCVLDSLLFGVTKSTLHITEFQSIVLDQTVISLAAVF